MLMHFVIREKPTRMLDMYQSSLLHPHDWREG